MKTFAFALGGGGARGLAHIAVIEALDDMGVKPTAIAGTSIGSLIGASYAAGMRGKDIRHHVIAFAHDWSKTRRRLMTTRAGKLADLFSGRLSQATQMDAEKFCEQFLPGQVPDDFSALKIPLIAMTTDLHRRQRNADHVGPAAPGARGIDRHSRPVPPGGRRRPRSHRRRHHQSHAVRQAHRPRRSRRRRRRSRRPGGGSRRHPELMGSVYATALVMGGAIVAAKLKHAAPDLVIRPNVSIFRTLGFLQASAIIRTAEAVKDEVKERLGKLLK